MVGKKLISRASIFFSKNLNLDLSYFIRGGLWITSSNVTSLVAGVFLSSLFSRIWPKDVYGQFAFLMSVFSFLAITTLPGMNNSVFQGSIENKDGIFKQAVVRVVLFSIFGAVVLIAGSIYFMMRNNPNLALSVFLSAFAFPFSTLGSLIGSYYSGKKNFKQSSIVAVCSNLFSVILTSAALFWFGSLAIVALFSTWSTSIINIIFTLNTLRGLKNKKTDKRLLKFGVFTSFTNFIWLGLDYSDKFFIPLFLGFEKTAIYTFAVLIPLQLQNFFKIFIVLGQPKIADVKERDIKNALFKKSFQLELLIFVIVVSYIFASPYIFKLLYPAYYDSIFLSQIFVLSLLYYPSNLFGAYLTKKRLIKESTIGTIIFGISSLAALLLFIYLWGLIGAIIAKLFARLMELLITQFIFFVEIAKEKRMANRQV